MVAAASFDDMIAITGYTIFIDIAVTQPGNKGWAIAHDPLSVIFGILAGIVAAYCCAATKLWNNKFKRTAVVLLSSLFMKFIFDRYGFTSGGALGSLTLGLVVKELWTRGQPQILSVPQTNHEYNHSVSCQLQSTAFDFVMSLAMFAKAAAEACIYCFGQHKSFLRTQPLSKHSYNFCYRGSGSPACRHPAAKAV